MLTAALRATWRQLRVNWAAALAVEAESRRGDRSLSAPVRAREERTRMVGRKRLNAVQEM